MKASYKLIFNRNKRLLKNGKAPVVLEVYFPTNRQRKYIPTGVDLFPHEWDDKKLTVSKKHENAPNIKHLFDNLVRELETYEYDIINKGKNFTAEILDQFIKNDKKTNLSFLDFYKREFELNTSLKRGTFKEHSYTLSILLEFKPDISFGHINFEFVQNFDNWLRKTKGLAQNTIHKHHAHVKRFLAIASAKGLFDEKDNPYKYFTSKKVQGNRVNLTGLEVLKLESLILPASQIELNQIREMFLFSCYAGLRFSDIEALKSSNIIESSNGLVLNFKMVKVSRAIIIPLQLLFAGRPQEILKKYYRPGENFVFPQLSNQHVNRQLKILAQMSGIDQSLSFHISRHTFGTLLAELTQNPYLIMDLMGHNDIQTSMIYIHRSQERINKQLKNISWDL